MPPKSILKKSTTSTTTKPAAKTREERHREIALHHAYLIQDRKDAESLILTAIETLIDFPPPTSSPNSPPSTSAYPTPADIDTFKSLIYPFTPNDYDELIEERRIDHRCGYVFCGRSPKTTKGGPLKIVRDGRVMPRGKAESWCSDACAKRALFVKVQLMETPAWERRAGMGGVDLEILTEEVERLRMGREEGLSTQVDELEGKMRELEVERGDEGKPARKEGMVLEKIVERGAVEAARAPERSEGLSELVEGYLPQGKDAKKADEALGDRELNI